VVTGSETSRPRSSSPRAPGRTRSGDRSSVQRACARPGSRRLWRLAPGGAAIGTGPTPCDEEAAELLASSFVDAAADATAASTIVVEREADRDAIAALIGDTTAEPPGGRRGGPACLGRGPALAVQRPDASARAARRVARRARCRRPWRTTAIVGDSTAGFALLSLDQRYRHRNGGAGRRASAGW
jgi:hypothetical protein